MFSSILLALESDNEINLMFNFEIMFLNYSGHGQSQNNYRGQSELIILEMHSSNIETEIQMKIFLTYSLTLYCIPGAD